MIVHQANMMHVGFLDLIVLQPILKFLAGNESPSRDVQTVTNTNDHQV